MFPLSSAATNAAVRTARILICAVILVSVGCEKAGPREYTEEELQSQRDELLAAYPETPPDTPEQIQQKEATVEATLPQVYELLEAADQDPEKIREAVELSMSLVTLAPGHREAKAAYCKARMNAFFANEGKDHYNALIHINSAVMEADRLRENFDNLSEDELQLCQEVYFNQARREGYFPDSEDAPDTFRGAIDKLMSSGFRDAERLRTEPNFQPFFDNPTTAPVLRAAIEQIEESGDDGSATDTSDDDASPQPE